MKQFLTLILIFITTGVFAQDLSLSVLSIDPKLSENADSVLREERIHYDLTDPKEMVTTLYREITIYNKRGNGDADAFAFFSDDQKIKNIEATIYDPLGKKIKTFKKRDFKEVSAVSGGTLYADSRVLYMDYTPTSYPYTLVFESEIKSGTTAFIPQWMPVSTYGSSTAHATLTVTFPPDQQLTIKERLLDEFDVVHTSAPGEEMWEVKDFPGLTREYLAPEFKQIVPSVKCAIPDFYLKGVAGRAGSWSEFGSWMDINLIQGNQELSAETIQTIKSLTATLGTKREKAMAIYRYVQDKVRYISVQVGIGGWKPMAASEVDRLGYGDCKALSNYTKSLLQIVDIPSYYTVLYGDTDKRSIDADFIAMQGNHAILGVPLEDGINWLECTSQEVPFGYLGDFTDDRDVVIVTPEGGKMARTRKYSQEENETLLQVDLALSQKGTATGNLIKTSTGVNYGDCLYLERLDAKELKEHYLKQWSGVQRLDVGDVELDNRRDSTAFKEKVTITAPRLFTAVGADYLFQPNRFGMDIREVPPRYTQRKTPFVIQRGQIDRVLLNYTLPEGFITSSLPEPVTVSNDFGSYTYSFTTKDNVLSYARTFKLNEGQYGAEMYEDFRNFYKAMVRHDGQKILIIPQS